MIGSGIIEGKTKELFEGDSVVDLGFQFRIGIDLKPLLKKKAFHKEKRRISIIPFKAFTYRVFSQKQAFNSGPVDNRVDLFHSFDSPVLFHRVNTKLLSKNLILIFESLLGIMPGKSDFSCLTATWYKKGDIGEGEVGFHIFEAHGFLQVV